MQSDLNPNSGSEYSSPRQFKSKLGTYLTGVVIGLLFLAMVYTMKAMAVQSRQAEVLGGGGESQVEGNGSATPKMETQP
tara:strand:- start:369174 stop:369410 length:237 start_codon:yes stop_codon:yes gene_type:complete